MPVFRNGGWNTLKNSLTRDTCLTYLRPNFKLQMLVTIRPLQTVLKLSYTLVTTVNLYIIGEYTNKTSELLISVVCT
jgi:hypothetical protein